MAKSFIYFLYIYMFSHSCFAHGKVADSILFRSAEQDSDGLSPPQERTRSNESLNDISVIEQIITLVL